MFSIFHLILSDHGFGSGRFTHSHFASPVSSVHGHDESAVNQLVNEVEETAADGLVQQLINMMGDPL